MNYNEHKDNPKSLRALTGLTHILRLGLQTMGLVPAQTDKELSARLSKLSQNGTVHPILLHDGTEREIPRPVDYDDQKEQYSGKKKRHTVKNAVIITVSCLILFVSQTVSSIRVRVEHAIGSAKFMRIVKDECRLRANSFVERIFVTCAALHNLRIKIKPFLCYRKHLINIVLR